MSFVVIWLGGLIYTLFVTGKIKEIGSNNINCLCVIKPRLRLNNISMLRVFRSLYIP